MINWGFWLLVVIVALAFISGTPVESQPIVTGAAALLTVPLGIINSLAASTWGLILLPVLFIGLVYYFRTLDYYLGNEVLYFIAFAALLIAFTAFINGAVA